MGNKNKKARRRVVPRRRDFTKSKLKLVKPGERTKSIRAEKRHIHVAVPTRDNVIGIPVQNFLAMCEVHNSSSDSPWKFSWEICTDKQPVEWARNFLTGHFIREQPTAEAMWMIDSDMGPPENSFLMLDGLKEADIVVGHAMIFSRPTGSRPPGLKIVAYNHSRKVGVEEESFMPIVPNGKRRFEPIDAGGTGSMIIKRRVFEDPRMHLDGHYIDLEERLTNIAYDQGEGWAPAIWRFRRKANGAPLRGEDLDFSWRATKLGYRVVADLGIRYGHFKKIDLNDALTFADYVAGKVREAALKEFEKEKNDAGTMAGEKQSDAKALRSGSRGG